MEQRKDAKPTDQVAAAKYLSGLSGLVKYPFAMFGSVVTYYVGGAKTTEQPPSQSQQRAQWVEGLKPKESPPTGAELAFLPPTAPLTTGFLKTEAAWTGLPKLLAKVEDLEAEEFERLKAQAEQIVNEYDNACQAMAAERVEEKRRRSKASAGVSEKTPASILSPSEIEFLGTGHETVVLCAAAADHYGKACVALVDAAEAKYEDFIQAVTSVHGAFETWSQACVKAKSAHLQEPLRRTIILGELKKLVESPAKEPENSVVAPAKLLVAFRNQIPVCNGALEALGSAAKATLADHAVAEKNARDAIDRLGALSSQLAEAIKKEVLLREDTRKRFDESGVKALDSDQLAAIPVGQPEYPAVERCIKAARDFEQKRSALSKGCAGTTPDEFRKLESAAQAALKEFRTALNIYIDSVNIYNKRVFKERIQSLERRVPVAKELIGLLATDSPVRLQCERLLSVYDERCQVFRKTWGLQEFESAESARDHLDESCETLQEEVERELSRRRLVIADLALPDNLPGDEELSLLKDKTEPKAEFLSVRNGYPKLLQRVTDAEKRSALLFDEAASVAQKARDQLRRLTQLVTEAAEKTALEELPGQLDALRGELEQFAQFVVKAKAHDCGTLDAWARKAAATLSAENFKQTRTELSGAITNLLIAFPLLLSGAPVFRSSLRAKMMELGVDLVRPRIAIVAGIESAIATASIRKVGDLVKLYETCNRSILEFQKEHFGPSGRILHTKAWFEGKGAAFGLMLPRAIGQTAGERLREVVKLFNKSPSQLRGEKDHPWARHIHVKGDGADNVVLDSRNSAVLGYCGHISSEPTDRTNLRDHNKLVEKAGDAMVHVAIVGDTIYEVEQ